jgi:hypothetical protein
MIFGALAMMFWIFGLPAAAQEPQPFQDELLANLAGNWEAKGTIRGRVVEHRVDAEWTLQHQFLQIHEKDAAQRPAYEAIVMVGYDRLSERYVMHWMDIYGARVSETLGYGQRSGNQIEFVVEYPEGPFHTVFRWLPESREWQWHMRTKDASGKWTDFAELKLKRAPALLVSQSANR